MVLKNIFLTSTFLVANLFFANAQLTGKWPPVDVPPPFEDEWKGLVDFTKIPAAPISKQLGDCPKDDWGLTFDDGPTEQTGKLLDFLDTTPNTKVTFFAVGSRIIAHPELVKRAITSNHQVGVHTWSHTPLTTQTNEQIVAEIKWTERAIQAAGGVTPNTLRPPQGDYDDRVRAIATALGYKIVLWDLDSFDWKIKSEPANRTPKNVLDDFNLWVNNATATTGHISLGHDLYEETVSLVPEIVKIVTGKGFNTTTVGAPSPKTATKAPKKPINAKNYEEAIKNCEKVLQYEPDNYKAYIYLGASYTELNKLNECENALKRAIEIDSSQIVPWKGLKKLYEEQKNWTNLSNTYLELLGRYNESKDAQNTLDTINKLVELYTHKVKDNKNLIVTLKYFLPESPYYDLIKVLPGVVAKSRQSLQTIISLLEKDEPEIIQREIKSRKSRINSGPPELVQAQVEQELEEFYDKLFEIVKKSDNSDLDSENLKKNYIEHIRKKLSVSSVDNKNRLCEKILKIAKSFVDQDSPSPIPYEILIESTNASSADEYDVSLLENYSKKFPETGLSKMIQGYFRYSKDDETEEALNLYQDYENSLKYAETGKKLTQNNIKSMSFSLDSLISSFELCIASCYLNIGLQFYSDALPLYKKVLKKDSNNILALQGVGIILSAQKDYEKSLEVFKKILKLDPSHHISKSEIGWIHLLQENYEEALKFILEAIDLSNDNALYYCRLGRIYWAMDDEYRKNKNYAYAQFIHSLKLDSDFACAFTYLGHYYRLIEEDHVRAKKCYQKAYTIDSKEEDAGFYLSEYYHSDGEFDLAEGVYQIATQTNPKAHWAWKRLGFLDLAHGNYGNAVSSFQIALKTNSKDISCWEGLAEAYGREGKYRSSLKTFPIVIELDPDSVNAYYQMGLVNEKLGIHEDAIELFNTAIKKAQDKGDQNHIPSLKGLGDCYLASVKEFFQKGIYDRSAESLDKGLKIMLHAIETTTKIQCFWKLIGDLSVSASLIPPNHLNLISFETIKSIVNIAKQSNLDDKLHIPKDLDTIGNNLIENYNNIEEFTSSELLTMLLYCGSTAYKYAIILSGNQSNSFPSLCLKLEPTKYEYWNALGIITMLIDAKISQHCFIKAIEFNVISQDPAPWTNIGILYLLHSDLELANQAFSKAQTLDPDYVPAWIGQAYTHSPKYK
ncbi:1503_t:CDS:10 [Entrophospora sp. SA101]|nr:1503_t:CDS:10 [Entrophospora sp. SA101]